MRRPAQYGSLRSNAGASAAAIRAIVAVVVVAAAPATASGRSVRVLLRIELRGPHQLDMIVASLPFETEALGRRQRARMFGRVVPLPTPEDLLVFKVLAGRAKDLVDAEGVARRHLAALDVRYVERAISAVADYAEDPRLLQRLADVLARAKKV